MPKTITLKKCLIFTCNWPPRDTEGQQSKNVTALYIVRMCVKYYAFFGVFLYFFCTLVLLYYVFYIFFFYILTFCINVFHLRVACQRSLSFWLPCSMFCTCFSVFLVFVFMYFLYLYFIAE